MENKIKTMAIDLIYIISDMEKTIWELVDLETTGNMPSPVYKEAMNTYLLTYSDFYNTLGNINYDVNQWNELIALVRSNGDGIKGEVILKLIEILEFHRNQSVYAKDRTPESSKKVLQRYFETDLVLQLLLKLSKLAKEDIQYKSLLIRIKWQSMLRYQAIHQVLFHKSNPLHKIPLEMPLISDGYIVSERPTSKVVISANSDALINVAKMNIDLLMKYDIFNPYIDHNLMEQQLLLETILELAEPSTITAIYHYFEEKISMLNCPKNANIINQIFVDSNRRRGYYIKPFGFIEYTE